VRISGLGLHSGTDTSVTINPADADTGVIFRVDGATVNGVASNVVDTSRGTTIGLNGRKVKTVEHLMAALHGSGVDNAVVDVEGEEMPAVDGSAKPFLEAINSVGTIEQDAERVVLKITEPVWAVRNGSYILAVPSDRLKITYIMRYDHPMIGTQSATFVMRDGNFLEEIAPARTFVLYEELPGLISRQLAKGGDLSNAIVVWQNSVSTALRFPDELVRHKVLDLVGDLRLLGCSLCAEIVAVKSGHALNVDFVNRLQNVYGHT
jgi:UDP-3-O-acyl N-acetylglucosamine deacetylase